MNKRQSYQLYLKGDIWKGIRKVAIQAVNKTCQQCGSKKKLVVHHKKYPKILGEETIDMLQCLCEDCHNICHGGKRRKNNRIKSLKPKSKACKTRIFTREEIREVEHLYLLS